MFQPKLSNLKCVRIQIRNAIHNTRRSARRPAPEPNPLEIHVDTGPLHARNLVKPLFFTVGVILSLFI